MLEIPDCALVALVGAPGPALRERAQAMFGDAVVPGRADMVGPPDPERLAAATARLATRALAVLDVPALTRADRVPLVRAARSALAPSVLLILPGGARAHATLLEQSLHRHESEGFDAVHVIEGAADLRTVPLACDLRGEHGPFDIIGDVHGCCDELDALLTRLGYDLAPREPGAGPLAVAHPSRRAVLVGDLTDRGPANLDVLRRAEGVLTAGGLVALGNHDDKVRRWLHGRKVRVGRGLAETVAELAPLSDTDRARIRGWLDALPDHLWLAGGALVVAHAGLPEAMHGRFGGAVRAHALYGDTTGETGPDGHPIRRDWAADYRGAADVVHGHTVVSAPEWRNRVICVDTGCVFGGRLTALRWPEREVVSVPAASG